ncbi:N-myc-interactor [Xyrichtys novacula]|uniref:N-myc-interactor n=1 Tax=Xyrichtys novacula TaxID=13765 RepID=A0AAV1GYX1_XYRNO|nr:N-myc-interactor [Xyrichtys novacula]
MADTTRNGEVDQAPGALRGPGEEDLQMEEAKRELETWKNKVKEAESEKAELMMQKHDEEELREKAQKAMMAQTEEREKFKKKSIENLKEVQDEVYNLGKRKQDLMDKLNKRRDKLQKKKSELGKLKQKFKILAEIPDSVVEFTSKSDEQLKDDQPIRAEFVISQRSSVSLERGQALITFEEEEVASQILQMGNCSVSCDSETLNVRPKRVTLDPAVKFEVHLQVSRKELDVSDVPPSMPEERTKDRLMLSFCRDSRGGGEVEKVEYDKNVGTATVTFLHPGVAETLVMKGEYVVDLDSKVKVKVDPVFKYELRKFQTFCGTAKRTVLLDGIKDVLDPEELKDHLEIHFQKPKNSGGEIECIEYVSKNTAPQTVFFTGEEEKEKEETV